MQTESTNAIRRERTAAPKRPDVYGSDWKWSNDLELLSARVAADIRANEQSDADPFRAPGLADRQAFALGTRR